MGSSRLPGKVLADVGGRPMLALLLDRLRPTGLPIAVATSDLATDDPVAEVALQASVEVVRGPEHDVLERFRRALSEHRCTDVVRITGDCPLSDPALVLDVLALHRERRADYTSNVFPRTFPKGLDVEVARAEALEIAARDATMTSEREHVMPYLYRRPEQFALANLWCDEDLGEERWTVDTIDDLEVIRSIVSQLPSLDASWRTILARVGRRETTAGFRLRPARLGDSMTLLRWRNDPEAVKFSPSGTVAADDHERWFSAKLLDPATRIWIGVSDEVDVGFVRVDVRRGVGTVSIAVAPERRGEGWSHRLLDGLLRLLAEDQQTTRLIAHVHEENLRSLRAFETVGFVETGGADGYRDLVRDDDATRRFSPEGDKETE